MLQPSTDTCCRTSTALAINSLDKLVLGTATQQQFSHVCALCCLMLSAPSHRNCTHCCTILTELHSHARTRLHSPHFYAGAFDRKLWLVQLEPFLAQWKQLVAGHSLLDARPHLPKASAEPVTAFVQLEFCNAIKLLKDVNGWLDELSRVLQGSALLTPDVLMLGSALVRSETPAMWEKRWDGPSDPLRWCRCVLQRPLVPPVCLMRTAHKQVFITG